MSYDGEINVMRTFGAEITESNDLGVHAIYYAIRGWQVFPLRGKVPAIPTAHPAGDPLRGACKGECGRHGHGVLDATTDLDVVTSWWSGPYTGANIGLRLPKNVMVLDSDPRNGADDSLAVLQGYHGELPETMTAASGRGDGGLHRYFRRPDGKLTSKHLGPGLDLKTSSGYVVAPPSIHPDTGQPYTWTSKTAVAEPPSWLVDLIRPAPEPLRVADRNDTKDRILLVGGSSLADDFTAATTWEEILTPHGWRCLDGDGGRDGARWLHPAATSDCSATVRHGCLFVYSPNTPFDVTEPSSPRGYTRFRAWAVLNYGGNLSAAARSFRMTGAL